MEKTLNKSKAIREAAEAYEIDENLSMRAAATSHHVYQTSIKNYLDSKTKPVPDQFAFYQKLSPVDECVLEQHIFRAYNASFPLTVRHLNDCANGISRMRGSIDTVGYYWHLNWPMSIIIMKGEVFPNINGYSGY
jgi:hypothetical protein